MVTGSNLGPSTHFNLCSTSLKIKIFSSSFFPLLFIKKKEEEKDSQPRSRFCLVYTQKISSWYYNAQLKLKPWEPKLWNRV